MNKEDVFFHYYNDLGVTNLAMCYTFKNKEGEIGFSKWLTYHHLMHYDFDEVVLSKPFDITKKQFIDKVTHRTILDIEIVLDIDDKKLNGFEFDSIKEKTKWICAELNKLNKKFKCFSTGSKGYHIHMFYKGLRHKSVRLRSNIKEDIISHYGGDLMKKGERCMIAMPNVKHWKSGKVKEEVDMRVDS